MKNGIKRDKQAFVCRDCGHKFTEQALIRGSRYSPEMVSLTLDLYFSGTSLRKTARILNDHFDLTLSNSSVFRWIQKFVPMITEYAQGLSPELSETWQADELFVKMKGGVKDTQYKQKNMAYLWNVMDRKTRGSWPPERSRRAEMLEERRGRSWRRGRMRVRAFLRRSLPMD